MISSSGPPQMQVVSEYRRINHPYQTYIVNLGLPRSLAQKER